MTEEKNRESFDTEEKGFVCTFPGCGKQYKRNEYLKKHLPLHTGEKNYICPISRCDSKYHIPYALYQHMKSHHYIDHYKEEYPGKLAMSILLAQTKSKREFAIPGLDFRGIFLHQCELLNEYAKTLKPKPRKRSKKRKLAE